MSLLSRFRLSPRWLILLIALAALAITTTSLMPHDEGTSEDSDCLVCKAGHQPLTELSLALIVEPPVHLTASLPVYRVQVHRAVVLDSGSPRAPPA